MFVLHRGLLVVAGIVLGALILLSASIAAATGHLTFGLDAGAPSLGSRPSATTCSTPPAAAGSSDVVKITAVVLGTSVSDVAMMPAHRRHLLGTVVPSVAREQGRLLVYGAGDDAERRPQLMVDVSYTPSGDNADNPEVIADRLDAAELTIAACLDNGLAAVGAGTLRSDPFGAVTVAAQAHPRRLVVLSDGIATTPACNLGMRDLRAQFRAAVLADCALNAIDLHHVEVWLIGIGLAVDSHSPDPTLLTDTWRGYLAGAGADVTIAAQTVPAGAR